MRSATPLAVLSQVAINWCMSKGALVIVGVKTPQQAADNLWPVVEHVVSNLDEDEGDGA